MCESCRINLTTVGANKQGEGGYGKNRVEAFSDGVLAIIIITIMVLAMKNSPAFSGATISVQVIQGMSEIGAVLKLSSGPASSHIDCSSFIPKDINKKIARPS
jgi:hypothetical protein